MPPLRTVVPFAAFAGLALICSAGCSGCNKSAGGKLVGGGATFVDPIMQKWATEYKAVAAVDVDYTAKGSGFGIGQMTDKNFAFGCSDAPMSKKELEAAKAGGDVIHIPVTIGAVAIVYHVPGVPQLKLSGDAVARIYLRTITKWNDPAIVDLNPGVSLPDLAIVPVSRAEDSGTTSIFTEYLSKVSPEFQSKIGISKKPTWPPGGTGQQGNGGIANHVKENAGSIGYVELSYARKNGLAFASIRNKKGNFVAPEAAAVTAAAEAAATDKPTAEPYTLHELTFSLTDTAGEKAYPIVGVSYAILFAKPPADKGGKLAVAFLKWVVTDGQKYAAEMDYAPLPEDLRKKCLDRLGKIAAE